MALVLKSDSVFGGVSDIPARAPLPNDATFYADFVSGLYLTQADVSTSATSTLVVKSGSLAAGFYYGASGLAYAAANSLGRVGHSADGAADGLFISPGFTNFISTGARINLGGGTATGATVAASGSPANDWQQWYTVTPTDAEAEASMAFPNDTMTQAYVWWSIDVKGTGIVQLGAKGDASLGYANFNLATGECWGTSDTVPSMILRAGGFWTLTVRLPAQSVATTSYLPYVASIAAIDTARLGMSGAVFSARSPRMVTSPNLDYTPPAPWPINTTSSKTGDGVQISTSLIAANAAFSYVMQFRAGDEPDRTSAGLFILPSTVGGYVTIQADAGGNFIVREGASSSNIRHKFSARWAAGEVYDVGVSCDGTTMCISINGEMFTFKPTIAITPYAGAYIGRGSSGVSAHWGGYLRKIIGYSTAKTALELREMCERLLWGQRGGLRSAFLFP